MTEPLDPATHEDRPGQPPPADVTHEDRDTAPGAAATSEDVAPGRPPEPSAATRPDEAPGPTAAGPPDASHLPPCWADRFRPLGPIPEHPDATHLHRYVDQDGVEVVVKAVRHGPDTDDVWQLWRQADPTHVVPLLATAVAGDIGYEVTPWQPLGSLRALARDGHPVDPATCRALVDQLAAALHHIHTGLARRLVHRDVKPANILIAEQKQDGPPTVRLTDFGVAVAQDSTYFYASSVAGTPAYDAPEAASGASSPARDWWSLGMVMLELVQGHHPYAALGTLLDPQQVTEEILTDAVPIDDEVDPRWRTLCTGLLTRNPRPGRRWGHDEVAEWLAGGSPDVAREASARGPDGAPFPFGGAVVHRPEELAAAIAADWAGGAALLVGRRWAELRTWAATFSAELGAGLEDVERVFVVPRAPVDRQVAEVLVLLDRDARPTFAGRDVTADGLAELARDALTEPEAERVVQLLYDSGALRPASRLVGQTDLAGIDDRWHRWVELAGQRIDDAVGAEAMPHRGQLAGLLLGVALDPDAAESLRRNATRLLDARSRRIGWFRDLAAGASGPDAPADHAAMLLTAPLLDDPAHTVSEGALARARDRIEAAVAAAGAARPTQAERRDRRRRRALLALAALGWLVLAAFAGAGIALIGGVAQGVLSATLLALGTAGLVAGVARPGRVWSDAVLGGWAGALTGLVAAAVLAGPVGAMTGPAAGWSVFWIGWVLVIVLGTVLGATR